MFLPKDHLYYETNDLGKFTRECFIINFLALRSVGLLVPPPRIEPMPSALEACSLNHWTTREVPEVGFAIMTCVFKLFLSIASQEVAKMVERSYWTLLLAPRKGHISCNAHPISEPGRQPWFVCFHSRLHGK